MKGTTVKCPNIVKNILGDDVACAYEGYILLEEGIFTRDSGYDPLACKVQCRRCQYIYIVFPSPRYTEKQEIPSG